MLSKPRKKYAYENSTNKKYPLEIEFQFKTAGKYFEVIDENAETVMVPYGEGKNIITELQTPYNSMPKIELIRSAQPYMVNVSRNMMQKLKDSNAVYMEKKSGIWILENNFYDEDLGVVPEGRKMSPLIIG
jgi:CRISPR-associated endonuclease/helicase Cas3